MRRREFGRLVGAGLALVVATPISHAQTALPVIGILAHGSAAGFKQNEQWFREGLAKGGIEIGRHATLVHAFTEGRAEMLPSLAADLAARKVALIASTGDAPTQIAKKSSPTIPIVFSVGSDPVAQGLVASLNRPGGNLTGVTNLNVELGPKRIEVLHEILPKAATLALLVNPSSSFTPQAIRDAKAAAGRLGRGLTIVEARAVADIEAVFPRLVEQHIGGLAISADAFFNNNSPRLAGLALQYRLPAIYSNRDFSGAGGLVSYGTDLKDLFRQQGHYAARVLKGERPADLPVQQAARIEMVVNLKTAAALGLTVPRTSARSRRRGDRMRKFQRVFLVGAAHSR